MLKSKYSFQGFYEPLCLYSLCYFLPGLFFIFPSLFSDIDEHFISDITLVLVTLIVIGIAGFVFTLKTSIGHPSFDKE